MKQQHGHDPGTRAPPKCLVQTAWTEYNRSLSQVVPLWTLLPVRLLGLLSGQGCMAGVNLDMWIGMSTCVHVQGPS